MQVFSSRHFANSQRIHRTLGKTLVGIALKELFGFGHTQSDNIKTKKTAPEFNRNIAAELKQHSFVYADRYVILLGRVAIR